MPRLIYSGWQCGQCSDCSWLFTSLLGQWQQQSQSYPCSRRGAEGYLVQLPLKPYIWVGALGTETRGDLCKVPPPGNDGRSCSLGLNQCTYCQRWACENGSPGLPGSEGPRRMGPEDS